VGFFGFYWAGFLLPTLPVMFKSLTVIFTSVVDPKQFFLLSGTDFPPSFGSGSQ
jgi:hypothetical protein